MQIGKSLKKILERKIRVFISSKCDNSGRKEHLTTKGRERNQ